MRDPERILPVLHEISVFWREHPHLRLGQILQMAAKDSDPFYMEEDTLVFALRCGMECECCEDRQLVEGAVCHNCGRKG